MDNESRRGVRIGMEVVGAEGDPLGTVAELGSSTFDFRRGVFVRRVYAVPYEAVARATSERIWLKMRASELLRLEAHGQIGTTWSERATGAIDHAVEAVQAAVDSTRSRLGRR